MTTTQTGLRQLQYRITSEDCDALRARLTAGREENEGQDVHALYFTSYRNRIPAQSPWELLATEPRFSLCYFDKDPSYLRLERQLGDTHTSAMVTEAECRALLAGETDWLMGRHNPVLQDFHDGLTQRMLLPQVLLTYHREIYTPEGLELCVALDTGIRATLQHMDFLDPQLLERDTAGQEGQYLLDIRYSDDVPVEVMYLLEETAPRRKLITERRISAY